MKARSAGVARRFPALPSGGLPRARAAALTMVVVTVGALVAPVPTPGQELARRIAAVGDGTVRLVYETREGVEICEQGVRIGDHRMMWRSRGWGDEATGCRIGSAEVEVTVRGGEARGVEVLLRERDRTSEAVELGTVSAEEAARTFLALAREGGTGREGEEFIFPAYLADVPEVWRDLLVLAKDRSAPDGVRKNALFWVGQEAAEAATQGLADVAFAEDEEEDVREAAVFALSQQDNQRSVPLLMELARTAPQAGVRRSALFWLAQSKDERVPAFFEAILLGRGGG